MRLKTSAPLSDNLISYPVCIGSLDSECYGASYIEAGLINAAECIYNYSWNRESLTKNIQISD